MKRSLLFLIIVLVGGLILFSYFFSGSRAGRLVSNEEYLASLREASRGKKIAGGLEPFVTNSPNDAHQSSSDKIPSAQTNTPLNALMKLILQLFYRSE